METKSNAKVPILIIAVVILAIAGVVAVLLNTRQTTAPSSTPSNQVSKTNATDKSDEGAAAPSERMAITFTNQGFQPKDITVKKGTVITVKNESSHSVEFSSADHPTHRLNPEMNLKVLAPGESASYTATKVGKWGYHDHIDARNTGTVTVTE